MFDSDMTCCICRLPGRPTQIHHIDLDNSNTVYANLAVICLECHSKVHTNPAFARGYSPALVTTYNENWRRIVSVRHEVPGTAPTFAELRQEVLLEIEIILEEWTMAFVQGEGVHAVIPVLPPKPDDGKQRSFLQVLQSLRIRPYTEELWRRIEEVPLSFTDRTLHRLESVVATYPQGASEQLQVTVMRTTRAVRIAQHEFRQLPMLAERFFSSSLPAPDLGEEHEQQYAERRDEILAGLLRRPLKQMIDAFGSLEEYIRRESELPAAENKGATDSPPPAA